MQMIRHDDITSHPPMIRFTPTIKQQGNYFRPGEQRTAFVHAHGDVLKNSLMGKFQRSQMWQPVATRFAGWLMHARRM